MRSDWSVTEQLWPVSEAGALFVYWSLGSARRSLLVTLFSFFKKGGLVVEVLVRISPLFCIGPAPSSFLI